MSATLELADQMRGQDAPDWHQLYRSAVAEASTAAGEAGAEASTAASAVLLYRHSLIHAGAVRPFRPYRACPVCGVQLSELEAA